METPPRSEQSIEEEIARATHEWRDHAVDGTPLGAEPICNCYQYARAIAPLLNRVRAEALREARDNVRASSFWADGSDNYAGRVRGYLSNAADRIEQNSEGKS